MKKTWIFNSLLAVAVLGSGCDPEEAGPEGQGSGTSGADDDDDSSTPDEPTSDTESPTAPDDDDGGSGPTDPPDEGGSSSTGEPECSFLDCPEDDPTGIGPDCDLWGQDCPDGEKCMPWANDGGAAWNAARCTPLDSSPAQPGDSCTVEGSGVSGIDNCAIGSMCWNVDEENNGVCTSLCGGSPNAPLCDNPADQCIPFNEGMLPLCLPQCDPLLGCDDGLGCYPGDVGFVCIPDASGPELGAYGDPCEYVNACDPGLQCAPTGVVPGCTGSEGCCTNFCDLSEPEPSADCGGISEGQECVSVFAEGQALPGLEDTGLCAIPE